MVHHDTDLYDLRVRAGGRTSVIDTTSNHLFWAPGTGGHGGRWVKAGALKYGTRLRTPGGSGTATVLGGWTPKNATGWMWDLTVPGDNDHDFYVVPAQIDGQPSPVSTERQMPSAATWLRSKAKAALTTAAVFAAVVGGGHLAAVVERGHEAAVGSLHDYSVDAGITPVLVHNANTPCRDMSAAAKARSALRSSGWSPKSYDVGEGRSVLLSTERMVHIMTRHMPDFFDGVPKATQTFFSRSASIDDVTNFVGSTVRQNSAGILDFLKNGGESQSVGEVGGSEFVLGMRSSGLIGQFFPR